jgi:hypothetical protein
MIPKNFCTNLKTVWIDEENFLTNLKPFWMIPKQKSRQPKNHSSENEKTIPPLPNYSKTQYSIIPCSRAPQDTRRAQAGIQ